MRRRRYHQNSSPTKADSDCSGVAKILKKTTDGTANLLSNIGVPGKRLSILLNMREQKYNKDVHSAYRV
jgi:hypothetical protein